MQRPVVVRGQRVSALRFGEPRTQALLGALVNFGLNVRPFTAADLRSRLAHLLDLPPAALSQGRLSYELRRLRQRGLIERLPKTHRYQVTPFGLRAAVFYSRLHDHLFQPGLSLLMAAEPSPPSRLNSLFTALDQALADQASRVAA
jgi:hypothetical protein